MIHFLTGKPGGGKGLVAVNEIVCEIATGNRVVVTDMPLRLLPWVRDLTTGGLWSGRKRRYQPERGMLTYLTEKHGQTFWAEKRIYQLAEDEAKEFYLRRYNAKTGEWFKLEAERDKEGRVVSFDTSVETLPVLYITDECWRTFGARQWQETGKGVIFYAAQHRKFGDEWFLVCQHTKQIDTALRQVAQDYWLAKNHSKLNFGPFRQPDVFTVSIYDSPPTPGVQSQPMERRIFRLDKKGLGSCYDTAAGTGVVGGGSADLLEKKRGLPFWVMCLLVLVVLGLLMKSPDLFGMAARKVFGGKSPSPETNLPRPAGTNVLRQMRVQPEKLMTQVETNKPEPIYYTGYFYDGKKIRVGLTDGTFRIVRNEFRDLHTQVMVDGQLYPKKLTAEFQAQPQQFRDLVNRDVPGLRQVEKPAVEVVEVGERDSVQPLSGRERFFNNN